MIAPPTCGRNIGPHVLATSRPRDDVVSGKLDGPKHLAAIKAAMVVASKQIAVVQRQTAVPIDDFSLTGDNGRNG
jgi:hypothetical protein